MERSRRANRFTPRHFTTGKPVPGVHECHEDLLAFRRGRTGDLEASSTYKVSYGQFIRFTSPSIDLFRSDTAPRRAAYATRETRES